MSSNATTQARKDLLDIIADATAQIARALAALEVAYEALDETSADHLEAEIFRPVQQAFGRAQRARSGFAQRMGIPIRPAAPPPTYSPAHSVADLVERAVSSVHDADVALSTLQDSMLPVDVGDPELRNDLAVTRQSLAEVPGRAREFSRTLGR
jgi:hypothetical protein